MKFSHILAPGIGFRSFEAFQQLSAIFSLVLYDFHFVDPFSPSVGPFFYMLYFSSSGRAPRQEQDRDTECGRTARAADCRRNADPEQTMDTTHHSERHTKTSNDTTLAIKPSPRRRGCLHRHRFRPRAS